MVTHDPVNGRGPAPLGGMSVSEGLRFSTYYKYMSDYLAGNGALSISTSTLTLNTLRIYKDIPFPARLYVFS